VPPLDKPSSFGSLAKILRYIFMEYSQNTEVKDCLWRVLKEAYDLKDGWMGLSKTDMNWIE
jgi:hypothetical protein